MAAEVFLGLGVERQGAGFARLGRGAVVVRNDDRIDIQAEMGVLGGCHAVVVPCLGIETEGDPQPGCGFLRGDGGDVGEMVVGVAVLVVGESLQQMAILGELH